MRSVLKMLNYMSSGFIFKSLNSWMITSLFTTYIYNCSNCSSMYSVKLVLDAVGQKGRDAPCIYSIHSTYIFTYNTLSFDTEAIDTVSWWWTVYVTGVKGVVMRLKVACIYVYILSNYLPRRRNFNVHEGSLRNDWPFPGRDYDACN